MIDIAPGFGAKKSVLFLRISVMVNSKVMGFEIGTFPSDGMSFFFVYKNLEPNAAKVCLNSHFISFSLFGESLVGRLFSRFGPCLLLL